MAFQPNLENWNMNILKIGCLDINSFTISITKDLEVRLGKLISKLSSPFSYKRTMKSFLKGEFTIVQVELKK